MDTNDLLRDAHELIEKCKNKNKKEAREFIYRSPQYKKFRHFNPMIARAIALKQIRKDNFLILIQMLKMSKRVQDNEITLRQGSDAISMLLCHQYNVDIDKLTKPPDSTSDES